MHQYTVTFTEAIERLRVAVDRTDLEDQYLPFINQAIHETCGRYRWDETKVSGTVTFAEGSFEAELPSDFMSWQDGRFCAAINNSPVPVYSRVELDRLAPSLRPSVYLLHQTIGLRDFVWLPAPAEDDTLVDIYYYAYPAEVTEADISESSNSGEALTTPMLQQYPGMIFEKAASLLFASINDSKYLDHERQWEKDLETNSGERIRASVKEPLRDKP